MYDELSCRANEVVRNAVHLFRFMSPYHVPLTKECDIMISGSTILMALQGERFDMFHLKIYCKRRVWFDLYHHLTLHQNMSLVSFMYKQRDTSHRYAAVHSVMTFRRSWNATKSLQVIVLRDNAMSIPNILQGCDFNITGNTFDERAFCCTSMYSVIHRSIACHKRKLLSRSRVVKYQRRGYTFCNVVIRQRRFYGV